MLHYTFKRLLEMIPTTLGILLLTFALFHLTGSPALVVMGKNATPAALAGFDEQYGYDKPVFCGQWARLRALEDGKVPAAAPVEGREAPGGLRVPLNYPLKAGTYRLSLSGGGSADAPAASVVCAPIDEGDTRTNRVSGARRDGSWQAVFDVPEGTRAGTILVTGSTAREMQLRRRTKSFLDSQFTHFLAGLACGDFGRSATYGMRVSQVLRNGIGPSLALTIPILIGGTLVAVLLGLCCAMWRGGRTDRSILLISTLLMSINYVVWVLAGQYFLAYRMRLFPIWGFENWTYLLLPVALGVLGGLGRDIRFYRAVILDEIYKPYVRTAWAKGLTGAQVMTRHVLRNSLIPIVTYVSLSIPFLFTGSLLLERFYGIPGLGCVSINAINSGDMAVLRAVVIIGALLYQGVNLLTDLCYAWLDPRVRLE